MSQAENNIGYDEKPREVAGWSTDTSVLWGGGKPASFTERMNHHEKEDDSERHHHKQQQQQQPGDVEMGVVKFNDEKEQKGQCEEDTDDDGLVGKNHSKKDNDRLGDDMPTESNHIRDNNDRKTLDEKANKIRKKAKQVWEKSKRVGKRAHLKAIYAQEEAKKVIKMLQRMQEKVKNFGHGQGISEKLAEIKARLKAATDPTVIRAEVCSMKHHLESLGHELKTALQITPEEEEKFGRMIKALKERASRSGGEAAQFVVTGAEIVKRLAAHPEHAKEIVTEITDKVRKKLDDVGNRAKDAWDDFQDSSKPVVENL
eukprot:jgi/Bigna1/127959/aug1.5_g2667